MHIAVLTSSRADYGIYYPLLRGLQKDDFFELEVIAFGTHLSRFHGYTLQQIQEDGYTIFKSVESMILGDSEEAVSSSMALTAAKFSGIWAEVRNRYDLIFCLGDRYEMFAAVASAIPFNLSFAHIHGGEETQGAIDNVFRHCITQMADYHFTATEAYKDRVKHLLSENNPAYSNVFNVGSISLDNLREIELLDKSQFLEQYDIDLARPTILFTFHPETAGPGKNKFFIDEILRALEVLSEYQIVITMPNADTGAGQIRNALNAFAEDNATRVYIIENFGTRNYFSCIKHAKFLMGNSSSGIIEAASFGKYVLNLGDRQKGRATGPNILNIAIDEEDILSAVRQVEASPVFEGENIYWNGGAVDRIIDVLKTNSERL